MKKYLLTSIAGILALSSNIVVAAPRGESPRPPQKVQSNAHGKQPEKSYSKGHDKGHDSWNDSIEVRAQKRLQKLGYYRGRIDGDFGRGSRAALVRFQRDKRIRVTGSLDRLTVRALAI